jgi:hypothetical protein
MAVPSLKIDRIVASKIHLDCPVIVDTAPDIGLHQSRHHQTIFQELGKPLH